MFSRVWTEYGDLLRKSLCLVQTRENVDQKNSEYKHFLRCDWGMLLLLLFLKTYATNIKDKLLKTCI